MDFQRLRAGKQSMIALSEVFSGSIYLKLRMYSHSKCLTGKGSKGQLSRAIETQNSGNRISDSILTDLWTTRCASKKGPSLPCRDAQFFPEHAAGATVPLPTGKYNIVGQSQVSQLLPATLPLTSSKSFPTLAWSGGERPKNNSP